MTYLKPKGKTSQKPVDSQHSVSFKTDHFTDELLSDELKQRTKRM